MNSSDTDPFYVVRSEVHLAMKKIHAQMNQWQELCASPGDLDNPDWLANSIKGSLRSVEWDLQDLDETITVVESNPVRFSLSSSEISGRRQFVNDIRAQIGEIRTTISDYESSQHKQPSSAFNSSSNAKALATPAPKSAHETKLWNSANTPHRNSRGVMDPEPFSNPTNDYFQNERMQQDLIMREQDVELGELGQTVKRIGNMGRDMHDELRLQGELMEDLDNDLDSTASRMRAVQQKLDEFIRESSKGQLCMILGLTLALVVLTTLVIIT
eukprot:CAMPEP_0182441556 /NCGR_PEP_ID=MMETSP1172-20130603/530_1 /TAXON_ID=708627 /ORGANISM="Timspurckia oligopyrenoides, Strain CCMP3278" /LENGTH=270 /DNA_ID=CAMNT_0024635911 /DNA_START=121 /DNA_END=933 /DNA_ORIENTATION=+